MNALVSFSVLGPDFSLVIFNVLSDDDLWECDDSKAVYFHQTDLLKTSPFFRSTRVFCH